MLVSPNSAPDSLTPNPGFISCVHVGQVRYGYRGWIGCSTGESRRALFDIPRMHQARCGGCYEEVDEFHGV